ncbi:MAG: YvcK family protein [Tissierellia bacterium]|nr:YvcK family protein [Tissierellia bacterium]
MNFRDPSFVVIGGGTGLSIFLKGLKRFSDEITAIVTMADNGGGSGKLRQDIGILPPGDIRNCLVALANTEPAMERLLQYRYQEGQLAGQNVGNLLIAALWDIYGDFGRAVEALASVLKITGRVLPVTTEDIQLLGRFEDGAQVLGEVEIPKYGAKNQVKIVDLDLDHRPVTMNPACRQALARADLIVLGPGSLYTSLIPNLLVDGMVEAIAASPAKLVYAANIMTQRGETHGLSLLDHIQVLEDQGLKGLIHGIVVNDRPASKALREKYMDQEGASQLFLSPEEEKTLVSRGIGVERGDFLDESLGTLRHDGLLLAQRMLTIADRTR